MGTRFYVQEQSKGGNWVDSLGSDEFKQAQTFKDYLVKIGRLARIIERVNIVLEDDAEPFPAIALAPKHLGANICLKEWLRQYGGKYFMSKW